eukprot:CAMPEP_0206535894 /NCGR_PEP_ID=MMETSP0325_2-20121206/6419_1 /ASSEMBLY_ACC=CAM_ASM_000347 /TAXON_ID=2866 /ORGANISM="Crypthecodinium cohnii, Strain Seligo" /LENGTH=833 /DNA_ID=CAMNT_0054032989 /DNA_START=81 /DNA_END=2579 /DNA_ORIENTATION=-
MPEEEKLPKWTADVPEPEVSLDLEDGIYRAELICYVQKGGRVKDIRVRGPARSCRKEARKDASELKKAAFKGGSDPALFFVRARRKELETVKWKKEDLAAYQAEDEKREREEAARRREQEQKMNDTKAVESSNHGEVLIQLATKRDGPSDDYQPVGPNWKRPGSLTQLPGITGQPSNSWYIHEKQEASGKYKAWLFFNSATGKYYQRDDPGYLRVGVPNSPYEYPIAVRVGSANIPSKAGKKLDMAVVLPELHKTGFLLKQPLEFMDKPASLFILCDGLRNSPAAADFCARRLHALLLPKLSARASEWEDFELADLLRDTVEALDANLLESPACFAGCNLAIGLVVGTKLVLCALGGVRCIVCRPPAAGTTAAPPRRLATAAAPAAPVPWSARVAVGGSAHTTTSEDERLRVESAGNRLADASESAALLRLTATSAKPRELNAISDERERLLLQIARAANPFATLGIGVKELKEGKTVVRKVFRKMSLVVHPDKVQEPLKPRAMRAFAKLEAAATSIEAMLGLDQAATQLMAEVDLALDGGRLTADPAVAAKLIGVAEGTAAKQTKRAVEQKFSAPLGRLQSACPRDVERVWKGLSAAEECVARGTALWTPSEDDEAIFVTRAMGCKDLKVPTPLLAAGLVAECIELEPGCQIGIAMLPDGLSSVSEADVAGELARHAPSRPRAAALRLALRGQNSGQQESAAAVCAYLDWDLGPNTGAYGAMKRARTAKPERVRISHILLRWAGQKGGDEFGRRGFPAPTRTQAEAEKELLELLEQLLSEDPKTMGARFKAQVMKRSECSTALNVPYADLGWIEPGGAEAPLEAAAFAMAVG